MKKWTGTWSSLVIYNTSLNVTKRLLVFFKYRIRPNYRPCPHNRPPLTFYFIFTYYCPLDYLFPDFLLYFHLLSST